MDHEAKAGRDLYRKAGAAALGYAYGKLRMLPVFKLIFAHPKFATVNFAEFYIAAAELEFAFLKAHWRGTVAAAATLVEHEFAEAGF